jgi:hypothetical protein
MKRLAALSVAVAMLLGLAACGERPQVTQFKQGTYQGKPDTPAYDNAPFNGNKTAWEHTLATRAENQNEYRRINQ